MIKKFCIIVDGYSSEYRIVNVFVENLVNQFQDFGVDCCVIAPQPISKYLITKTRFSKCKYLRETTGGNHVVVYAPKWFSFSAKKLLLFNTASLTLCAYRRCVEKTFKKMWKHYNGFDAVYGHFIFPAGIVATELGRAYNIPSFFAYGENGEYSINYLGEKKTRKLLNNITGVVSVSSLNKRVLIERKIVEQSKIEVFPNSIDGKLFCPKNKQELRKQRKISDNCFVVAFVGRFLDVKGVLRLDKALSELDDENVYAIFVGEGPQEPTYNRTLYCGKVDHKELPNYLALADVFVLPTIAEGCCNAIVEALGCGLPVISSNEEFNDDILDDSCSIRIDSLSIEEIKGAILELKNDSHKRKEMSKNAVLKARALNIEKRAMNILSFIEKKRDEYYGK